MMTTLRVPRRAEVRLDSKGETVTRPVRRFRQSEKLDDRRKWERQVVRKLRDIHAP